MDATSIAVKYLPKYITGCIESERQLMKMGSGRKPSEDDIAKWIKESIETYLGIHSLSFKFIDPSGDGDEYIDID